jgi:hypothetical protein
MWVDPQQAPPGALDADQLAAVTKLRSMIADARGKWLSREPDGEATHANSDAILAEADAHTDDLTLHRFVVSRPESLAAACEMYCEAMEWRANRGVSALFAKFHPRANHAGDGCAKAQHEAARAMFYAGFAGFTRDGRPFFVERLGAADLAGYSRNADARALVEDAYVAHLETVFRTVRAHSSAAGAFTRCTIVIDCSGLSFSTLTHIGLVKAVSKIGPPNFPEGSQQVLVVNAPLVISAAYALVSPLLPARTRAKVSINASRSTRSVLNEIIDDSQLPSFLGGTKKKQGSPDDVLIGRAENVPTHWVLPRPDDSKSASEGALNDSMVSVSLGDK